MDCLFCKIIAGEIPCTKIYEDDEVLAFLDINPQAPVHFLVIPKIHIQSLAHINESNCAVVGKISLVISNLAKEHNLADGFRVITNIGENGAQSVNHLHFHVIGGTKLTPCPSKLDLC